jgi:hypothetical protein
MSIKGGLYMKTRTFFLFGMAAMLLSLGLILAGCATTGSGNPGTAPGLTDFITLSEENSVNQQWTPQTSFGVNDGINVAIKGYDLEGDLRKLVLSAKRDGSDAGKWELKISRKEFTQFWGSFQFSAGEYTFEVYAVDAKGNQSNTLTTAFSVQ